MTDRISEERAAADTGERQRPEFHPYHHPALGWGAAKSVTRVLIHEREPVDGPRAIMRMNHDYYGFDCAGCAWPDDTKGLRLDICENGIKHVTWEMTHKRVGREFFAARNTTIYSDDDRYRGIKNLRALIFMNPDDLRERKIKEFDDVDIVATARDGSTRALHRYKAIPYEIPPGCAAGYMPEMNVLRAIGDFSTQSDQPIMKNLKVTARPSS